MISNGASTSIWHATATVPVYPPLSGDAHADVCVIGAGIAGLTSAYLLSRQGMHVTLIDAAGIGAGETGRTTAHFFPPDEWYADLEDSFGAARAALVADSYASAIARVEEIIRTERIDCEFERLDGYLYALPGNGLQDLDKELAAATRAGVQVEQLARVPGLPFDTGPCIRYPGQAQFHPLKYLDGLARAVISHGGVIHGATQALKIDGDRDTQVVTTNRGEIRAGSVVVATNTPFNNRVVMHTKQAGYQSYVVGIAVPTGSVPRILLWDTGDPYYYLRLETAGAPEGHEVLVVGGADHKVGQDTHPEHRYAEIERWVRERYPMAGAVLYRWSGEVMEPADGLAFLGVNPLDEKNVYLITGDSGNGMTHCTIGAMLVSDLILGRPNPWAELYDPARKMVHGLSDFVGEQVNTMARYGDWAKGGEVESVRQIPPGQGAIVNQGLHKLAVYRDEQGALHALSAKCTHLGCVVHFNSAERSWDCPCHGSRFDTSGAILHGPAATPLEDAMERVKGIEPSS
jgi:glycine/D-amino acid oxidase-like deaminating enzyme/nitrite reductase/ring-hydroxylating ferredoxin subunit